MGEQADKWSKGERKECKTLEEYCEAIKGAKDGKCIWVSKKLLKELGKGILFQRGIEG